jgi:hypothetical protein
VILRGSRSAFVLTADLDAELYVTSTRRASSSNTRVAFVRYHRPSSVCSSSFGCTRIRGKAPR